MAIESSRDEFAPKGPHAVAAARARLSDPPAQWTPREATFCPLKQAQLKTGLSPAALPGVARLPEKELLAWGFHALRLSRRRTLVINRSGGSQDR